MKWNTVFTKTTSILIIFFFMMSIGIIGCDSKSSTNNDKFDSWMATDGGAGKINMDSVREAIDEAADPSELETLINQIYEGNNFVLIQVAKDDSGRTVISGWEDVDGSGSLDQNNDVKLFSAVMGEKDYDLQGYGRNSYYSNHYGYSPTSSFATGVLVAWWLTPSYSMYYTPMSRVRVIQSHRTTYRSSAAYKTQKKTNSTYRKSAEKKYGKDYKTSVKKESPKRKKHTEKVKADYKKRDAKKKVASGGFGNKDKKVSKAKNTSSKSTYKKKSSRKRSSSRSRSRSRRR